jgi:hypothetical protein
MQHRIARWQVDHDPDTTRGCYLQLPSGTGCDCSYCRNFNSAKGRTFPEEFHALADLLGVDPTKPAELCHWCREPSGLYLTGGWFHFVGTILAGEDVVHRSNGAGTYRFEELVPGFEFGFGLQLDLVPASFAGLPLVQLAFQTRVPWVLEEAEPTS